MKKGDNLIIGCSGAKHLIKAIAKKSKTNYCNLEIERFPDTELKIRITKEVKGKNIYFVQSFYKSKDTDVNDKLIEVLFAAHTARELGAKKVFLVSPYLVYLREDKRFKKGEAVSAKILANFCKVFDKVYVLEPHLHRFKSFKEFFPNAVKISLSDEAANYIKKKIKGDYRIVGPDIESKQWVKSIADKLNKKYSILEKQRFSSRKVKIKGEKISSNKVIIIDDIISTGHTLIEATKLIKAKEIYFIGMHGLFSENAVKKLNKKGKIIVSNSIPSKASKIDCTNALAKIIK